MYIINMFRGNTKCVQLTQSITTTWINVINITGSGKVLSVQIDSSDAQGRAEIIIDGVSSNPDIIANPVNFFICINEDATSSVPFIFLASGKIVPIEFNLSFIFKIYAETTNIKGKIIYTLD